ncbi:hypothetical protein ACSYGO_19185 [Streptomyces krungchingensis]
MTALVGWVTEDRAPDNLLTESVDNSGNVTAARPVHPFPYVAENTTGGPADQADSYRPVRSAAGANLALKWLGSFRSGYETVGNWVDGRWVVTKGKA